MGHHPTAQLCYNNTCVNNLTATTLVIVTYTTLHAGGPVPYGGNAPSSALAPHRPASSPAVSSLHSSYEGSSAAAAGGADGSTAQRSARSSHSGSVYEAQQQPHSRLHLTQQQQQQQQPRVAMSVPKLANALLAGPKLWSEKVGVLTYMHLAYMCEYIK